MNFVIRSNRIESWHVHLADTDQEHAESVLAQLLEEPSVPDDLYLDPEVEEAEEIVSEPEPVKRPFFKRILRRG